MIKLDKSKVVRNLGKKYKVVPYLEKGLIGFEDDWQFQYSEKERDHHWHPSSHCTSSVTELYDIATAVYEPEVLSAAMAKVFQTGHFWHQLLQYVVLHKLEMCKPEAIERKGKHEWGDAGQPYHAAAGSGDIAPIEVPGWKGIVDFKSMKSVDFNRQGIPESYSDKYVCQANIYMDFFDEEQAIILPINKDTGEFKEYLFERDQRLIDAIYRKWEFVSSCLDAGEPPTEEDNEIFTLPEIRGPVSV